MGSNQSFAFLGFNDFIIGLFFQNCQLASLIYSNFLMFSTHRLILLYGLQSKSSTQGMVISWKAIKSAILGSLPPRKAWSFRQSFQKLRRAELTTLQVNYSLKVGSPNLTMGANKIWKAKYEHFLVLRWWKSRNQLILLCFTRSVRGYQCSAKLNLRQRQRRMVWLYAKQRSLSVS